MILLHRGVTISVVKWSHDGLERHVDLNGAWMVQSRHNFDNDGTRPVLYLQLVSPEEISSPGT